MSTMPELGRLPDRGVRQYQAQQDADLQPDFTALDDDVDRFTSPPDDRA